MSSSAEYLKQLLVVNESRGSSGTRFLERTVTEYAQQLRQASLRFLYISTSSSLDNKVDAKSMDALKEEMHQLSSRLSGLRAYAHMKLYSDVMGPQNEARAQLADMIHDGMREDVSRMQKHVKELRSRMDLQDTFVGLEAQVTKVAKQDGGGNSADESNSESEVIVSGHESESESDLFSDDPSFFASSSSDDGNENKCNDDVKVITITGSAAGEMNNVHGEEVEDEDKACV